MAKPKVHATHSQLSGAFRKHYTVYLQEPLHTSHQLLLFYAIECGLKCVYLRSALVPPGVDTNSLSTVNGKPYGHGHDLPSWVNILNIPAYVFHPFTQDDPEDPIQNVQEKLKYGVPLNGTDQIDYLKKLGTFITNSNHL